MLGFVGRRSLRIRNDSETDDSREEVLRKKTLCERKELVEAKN